MIEKLLISMFAICAAVWLLAIVALVGAVCAVMYVISGFNRLYQKFELEVAKVANLIQKS